MFHSEPFYYPRLKLARARKHIEELTAELHTYAQEVVSSPTVHLPGVPLPDREPPEMPQISGVLGDIFHNMRSSLDQMACEVVRRSGESPNGVHFPFAKSEDQYAKQIKDKLFHRAGDDAVALLWTFAPFHGGNAALWSIHAYNIRDKHKDIILYSLGGRTGWEMHYDDQGRPSKFINRFTPEFSFIHSEKVGADNALDGQPLIPTLHQLVDLCDSIIDAFAALIAGREVSEIEAEG